MPASKKRMSVWIYIFVSFGIFILAGFNFVFTKLLDRLYGNFNALDVEYIFGWTMLFIFGFGIYLWAVDIRGILAKMLGQTEDKDKKDSLGASQPSLRSTLDQNEQLKCPKCGNTDTQRHRGSEVRRHGKGITILGKEFWLLYPQANRTNLV